MIPIKPFIYFLKNGNRFNAIQLPMLEPTKIKFFINDFVVKSRQGTRGSLRLGCLFSQGSEFVICQQIHGFQILD